MKRRRAAAPYAKALGSRQVVLEQIVDSDTVALDGSLDGQLDRMRRRLANDEQ